MAKTLSNNGIVLNQIIYPQQVSQSIDAFTGADNYDITISGSFTVTGSTSIDGNVTVDGAITMEGNVVAPNLTSTAQSNVVTYNSINGQFYYTSSAAISPATASNAISASYAATASYVQNAQTASYVTLAQTSSYVATASWALNAVTASYVQNAQTASYVLNAVSASYASTASYVANAQTASYVNQAVSASYATTSSYAVSSSAADSAISASYSTTASFAQNTTSASYAVSASHANSSNTSSYAIFASASLIANAPDKQDFLLYKNTFFANEGVKDISTALTELGTLQGSVLYIGPGAYSGSDVSITTPNISLNAPESGAGPGSTITQLSGARGVTISGASVIRVRLNNMQLGTNGLTINGTLGRHRVYNCQLPQIVFTGATTDFIYFDKCDIGNITIPNTFAGVVYILNSTISGTITNNAPLGSQQLIISNTTGIPSTFTTYYNTGIVYNTLNETLVNTTQLTASNAKITGSLFGTASYAMQTATASYVTTAQTSSYVTLAQTSSYITLAQTASYVATASYSNNSTTASYALTASYLAGYVSPFPFTGSAQITGSLGVTGSANISGDLVVNGTASFNVFHTIYNSSSIIYASGSTKFGDTSDDTHQFTGSLYVSGSVTADTFTGTASYATQATTASFVTLAQTASYVTLAQTASYVNQAVSASYSTTASFVSNAQTASYITLAQTASYVNQAVSASFASTASYVANAQTASYVTLAQTASYVANAQTASYVAQAVSASYATTASYVQNAQTASYITLAQTASYVATASYSNNSLSSSYALTASHVTGIVAAFPYTGSAQITGSLGVTGSVDIYKSGSTVLSVNGSTGTLITVTDTNSGPLLTVATGSTNILVVDSSLVTTITGSLNVQNGVTASLFGTASWAQNATTASFVTTAQTASYVLNAVSASYVATASYVTLAQTSSYVTLAQTASYVLNAVSASYAVTASYVATASYALNAMSASLATTASYAINGGVTQLVAGPNITLAPTNGIGQVTISSAGAGTYYNTSTGSYGSFYDTHSYSIASTTTAYSASLDVTDITNGVYVTSPDTTKVYFANAGVYNYQFSTQFENSSTENEAVNIWLRKGNGSGSASDVAYSNSSISVPRRTNAQNGEIITSVNFYINAAANDYIQLMFQAESTTITLLTKPAGTTPTTPLAPCVIVTANRIDTFLSNTGSFSGSFNGVLNGTASYATQAATASYVVLAQTASFVTLAQTASYVLNAVSASFASTASYVNQLNQTVNISGSLFATGSVNIYRSGSSPLVVSGSQGPLFEITDSVSGSLWTIYTGSSPIFDVSSGRIMTLSGSATITGSLTVQNGITGSLFGTASWAQNATTASFVTTAQTASYVVLAQTASYVAQAVSASFASTASYVLNAVSSSFASTASFVNQLNQTVRISGSLFATGSVDIYKSGSTVFAVSGSNGPLFDITDVVSGSLFTVWTGSNRILQANSDYTTILGGASSAAALFTTTKNTANSGSTTIYTLPTASYDSIHVDYNIRSGSVSRAGNLFAIWSGSSVNQIETSASSFGDTSGFTFGVIVSGSNLALTGSTSTSSWTVKTIIRSI